MPILDCNKGLGVTITNNQTTTRNYIWDGVTYNLAPYQRDSWTCLSGTHNYTLGAGVLISTQVDSYKYDVTATLAFMSGLILACMISYFTVKLFR